MSDNKLSLTIAMNGQTLHQLEIDKAQFSVVINGNAEWVSMTKELREKVSAMLVDGFRRSRAAGQAMPLEPHKTPARLLGFPVRLDPTMPDNTFRLEEGKD